MKMVCSPKALLGPDSLARLGLEPRGNVLDLKGAFDVADAERQAARCYRSSGKG
jgi:hypothetical protein